MCEDARLQKQGAGIRGDHRGSEDAPRLKHGCSAVGRIWAVRKPVPGVPDQLRRQACRPAEGVLRMVNRAPEKAGTEESKLLQAVILLAVATGLMLSPESLVVLGNNMGFAGISFVTVVLAAVVLHLNCGAVHLAVLIARRRTAHRADLLRAPGYPVATAIALSAVVVGVVGLAWSGSVSTHLLRFMTGTFAVVFIFGPVWTALNRRKDRLSATGFAES